MAKFLRPYQMVRRLRGRKSLPYGTRRHIAGRIVRPSWLKEVQVWRFHCVR